MFNLLFGTFDFAFLAALVVFFFLNVFRAWLVGRVSGLGDLALPHLLPAFAFWVVHSPFL